jgi:hypothetical protein
MTEDETMLSLNRNQPAANLGEMAARAGVQTVTAAWPTGFAHLGFAVTACERARRDRVCRDCRSAPTRAKEV